jgi:hypothetical protein
MTGPRQQTKNAEPPSGSRARPLLLYTDRQNRCILSGHESRPVTIDPQYNFLSQADVPFPRDQCGRLLRNVEARAQIGGSKSRTPGARRIAPSIAPNSPGSAARTGLNGRHHCLFWLLFYRFKLLSRGSRNITRQPLRDNRSGEAATPDGQSARLSNFQRHA